MNTCYPRMDTPLLMIGIGGMGLRMLSAGKKCFHKHFSPQAVQKTTRFLAVDTDSWALDHFSLYGDEACCISVPDLTQKLASSNRKNLPACIDEWLSPDLVSCGTGVDGASCVRQIGRLGLFSNVNRLYTLIVCALRSIADRTRQTEVFIAASLSGGTGSGCLLDTAYLVRHAAHELGMAKQIRLTALAALPDVHTFFEPENFDLMRANAYAALKELDYWMNAEQNGAAIQTTYAPMLTVRWNQKPFDDCFLLSGANVDGGTFSDPIEELTKQASEFMWHIFAAPPSGQHFDYFSWRSHVPAHITHRTDAPAASSSLYSTFGCSSIDEHCASPLFAACPQPDGLANAEPLSIQLQLPGQENRFFIRTLEGLPLQLYRYFTACENAYRCLIAPKGGHFPGIHLNENGNSSGYSLPAPGMNMPERNTRPASFEEQPPNGENTLLSYAPLLADLFAFGILTRPTPMHVNCTMDGAPPQTIYNSMRDNPKYAVHFHPAYASEMCLAAKLKDLEDPGHGEHDKLLQLKTLEKRLTRAMEGSALELPASLQNAFTANAQTLKSRLVANHTAILLASPMSLNMTLCDKQLCLNFLQDMMDTLDARALAFGMMLI